MKKRIVLLALVLGVVGVLGSCGHSKEVVNTIELSKKGEITECSYEDFSASYYNEEELDNYISEQIAEYNGEGSEDVKVDKFAIKDLQVELVMDYKDDTAYKTFNKVTCFTGTVLEAQTAGYRFDKDFTPAENTKKKGNDLSAEDENVVDKAEILKNDGLKVFIVQTDSDITVPGKIKYVSANGTTIIGDNTVKVEDMESPAQAREVIYILYK